MFKPTIFCYDACFARRGLFGLQERPVSISLDIVNLNESTPYKVLVQLEPPQIRDIVPAVVQHHARYDLILAWDKEILQKCPNAVKFVPYDPWLTPARISKSLFVSFLTSSKNRCPGHLLRLQIFDNLVSSKVEKHRSPPWLDGGGRTRLFQQFQFNIVVENAQCANYFSEKLLDCFVSQTIPIYWGCPNLSEFFNASGVLTFQTYDELVAIIDSLTPQSYVERAAAIDENLQQAIKYINLYTRIDAIIAEKLKEIE